MDRSRKLRFAVWIIVIGIWAGLNYYIGCRGWQIFGQLIQDDYHLYWGCLAFLALSYIFSRMHGIYVPGVSYVLNWIGSYWMAAFVYILIALLMVDTVQWLDGWLGLIPAALKPEPVATALVVVVFIALLLIYGSIRAHRPVCRQYHINIAKPVENLEQLHIVMVSDLHLGHIVHNKRLAGLVKQVNCRQPDIILLLGDVIEEDVRPFLEQGMLNTLRKLTARLGVFAVMGNHEYTGGQYQQAMACLEAAGITILLDKCQLIDNSFYLVGRDDRHRRHRLELEEITAGIDHRFPIILMEHNPADLSGARANGIDLQLSGHTHRGQFWPIQLFTERIFETDWGYLSKDGLQLIVSCGFGTWGPPIRIGSTPEMVEIFVTFGENVSVNRFSVPNNTAASATDWPVCAHHF